ncbi:hypothetical protein F9278_15045 [Streptomyces phaeolivaceus]|uniref:DUF6545 domain-containing protein n=1 Tax=Streptomyces phaeolivaceus TaxID=2653200 RepID=A0A5P8K231_9ACTN|nr:MAB_1171c family putative transporter [Streptomyces phaeolivaceus]QFQ97305.1 hypothetical protein F9278_15045 [Streptomyces phaeolivaceus]
MSVADAIVSLIIALLLLQAVIRIPAALLGRRRARSLWGAFAAFSLSWCLRTDAGRAVIDVLGVNDLPTLLKHVLGITGICVLLTYVTDVYSSEDATALHIRITSVVRRAAARTSLATILCLAGVFFFALDRSKTAADSPYFMGRHAGEPGLAVYMGLFYLYTAAAAAVCGYQWGRAARHAHRWALRIGLALMASGMALVAVYAVVRISYVVVTTIRPVSLATSIEQENFTDGLLYAGFLLWALGSITPATRALIGRIQSTKDVFGLYPLWRDLAVALDGIALYAPSNMLDGHRAAAFFNTARDVISQFVTPQVRLGRYVTEIRDSIQQLRRRAPADLFVRARQLAESQGHTGADADAVAEAYWIKAALTTLNHPAGAPTAFETEGSDFATEVSWLLRVADAYRRASPDTATKLLVPTTTPASHLTRN